jgi:MFS transporter, DHA2 family, multidrug resistance protein
VGEHALQRPGHPREIDGLDEKARVPDLSPAAAAHEAPKLLCRGPFSPRGLFLERAERPKIALCLDDPDDLLGAECANQLVLEIGDAHVEAERLHVRAREAGAEPGSLETATELRFLADVTEAREREAESSRAEPLEEAPDRLRASDRHHGDALGLEVPAAARGERLDRDLVADPLDEHDGAHGTIIFRTVVRLNHMDNDTASLAGRREWIGLAVLALACVVYAMDLTVLHLAVPSLSEDLKPTSAQLLWIVDIYGFMVAGALITMGTLGDRIGRRRLLLIGAVAFGLASLLAAFSTSAEMLIVSRALLGIAGATIAPSTLSLIRNMFHDPGQRRFAIGVWIMAYSLGGAIGPLLGGALLEFFWWGSVFLLGVPVMALLLVLGPFLLPEYKDPGAGRIDLPSAALSLVAVLAVVYGLKQIAQDGLEWLPVAAIVAGLALGLAFVQRQRRLADPLIDLQLFRVRAFSGSLAVYTLGILVLFGAFLFIFQYLQLVADLSPFRAGLWTLPSFLAFIAGSMLTPVIAKRVRPAYVMSGGLAIGAAGFAALTQVSSNGDLAVLVAASVVFSLGLAPLFTLANDLILATAPPERAGGASAISETGAELGGALSIAILGTLGTAVYRNQVTDEVPAAVPPEQAEIARDTLGGATAGAESLPESVAADLLEVAREAFTLGLQVSALASAVLAAVTAVVAAVLLRDVRLPTESESAPDLETGAAAVPAAELE